MKASRKSIPGAYFRAGFLAGLCYDETRRAVEHVPPEEKWIERLWQLWQEHMAEQRARMNDDEPASPGPVDSKPEKT